ncbi:phage major tail tube protein [bacterium]|nr:phage major tail tube protein [bacterium]NBS52842.1 phage major tail tube protein [Spartobacteria bacterium]
MATASNILKNFNLYVDGRGFAGVCDELQLPTLGLVVEDFRAGGMDASVAVEMGQEKMEASFTLSGYEENVLNLWGVGQGQTVPLVARGALESLDGSVTPVVVYMTGTIRTVEPGAWKAGEKSTLKFAMDLRSYKYTQAGRTINEIDIPNMIRVVNGTDRLAAQRNALGI